MNKNRWIIVIVLIVVAGLFFGILYMDGGLNSKIGDLPPGMHGVVVKEVVQTNNYTYLNVEENDQAYWIAVVSREAKPGDVLYYSKFMEMKNFESRELQRTFPSVLFVDDISDQLPTGQPAAPAPRTAQKPSITKWDDVKAEVPSGGITIADLYKNPGNYSGKEVIIRGVVTKYNPEIMKRNWVHIQDGSEYEGKFDLTITTNDSLTAGKYATFKGTISLNKDFGSGYYYDIIMEQARATDVK